MSKTKFEWRCFLLMTLCLFCMMKGFATPEKGKEYTLLYITSYGTDSYQMQDQLLHYLNDNSHRDYSYIPACEAMGCDALTDVNSWQKRMDDILKKYPNPKAIVLQGNEAVITYFSPKNEQFKHIPVYVLQCNSRLACLPASMGIASMVPSEKGEHMRDARRIMEGFNVRYLELTSYDPYANMDLLQRLYGHTEDVAVLTDNTYTGWCMQQEIKEAQYRYTKWNFHYIDGCYLTMQQALEQVKALPPHTVMLLGCWKIDRDKTNHLSNAVYAFKAAKPAVLLPVFSFSGAGVGYWAVGGKIPRNQGKEKMAIDFFCADLDKGMTGAPKTVTLPLEFVFDETQLPVQGLAKSELPEGAVYLNTTITMRDFIQQYKWQFILAGCIVVLLVVISIGAVTYSVHITRLKMNLQSSEASLAEEKKHLEESLEKLKSANERVEQANLAKTYFLSNMNHEIRTPLNSIVGFSQVIVEMTQNQPELAEYAQILNQNSEGLLRLINGLLEISDIKSGKKLIHMSRTDVIPYLEGAVENARFLLKPEVSLSFTSPYETLMMYTDHGLIMEVMAHLLSNATKFTTQGSIQVMAEKDETDKELVVTVTDTGCGISDEIRRVIFDRFDKADEFIQGTGIGLTVCQTIVEAMDGRIWLDDSYRTGARFIVALPIRELGSTDV